MSSNARLAITISMGRNNMSVMTSAGEVPYKKVKLDSGVFFAPVCVVIAYDKPRNNQGHYRVFPLRNLTGKYIYALPGGLHLTEDGTVFDPNQDILS